MMGPIQTHLLPGNVGTVVVVAWTVVLASAGIVMLKRRDVN
jgi:hypothetical protein